MTSGGGMGGEGQAVDVLWTEVRAIFNERSFRDIEKAAEDAGAKSGAGFGGRFQDALKDLKLDKALDTSSVKEFRKGLQELEGQLEAELKTLQKGTDAYRDRAQQLVDVRGELDKLGSKGASTGELLKDGVSTGLKALPGVALAVAAAVGAALVGGVKTAFDIAAQARQGVKEMQSELGVTGEEARRLGEVAKTVFGNNWGGSLAEAQEAVKSVRREVQGLTDEELGDVAAGSLAIAQRFQEDQSKVAAAVESVMKATGAGAEEALDLITAGFQRGLNSSGDLLDTLNEYGPIFQKAKITGGELFSLLETGAAKGALGTDKIADSFKEFGFSLADSSKGMVAAFADLGINQAELTAKIDSGAMTQTQAYQLVMDKLKGVQSETKRMEIMSQIFKGAGEDLGAVAGQIDLTKTKLSDLTGSNQQVKYSFNSMASVFQTAWRQVQLQLQPVGDLLLDLANEAMPHVKRAIDQLGPYVTAFVRLLVDGFKRGRETVEELAPTVQQGMNTIRPLLTSLGNLFESVFTLAATLWQDVLKPTLEAIAPYVGIVMDTLGRTVKVAVDFVTNIINALAALLRGDWSKAWEYLAGAVVGALDGVEKTVKNYYEKMLTWGRDLGGRIVEGFRSGLDGIQGVFQLALSNALNKVADSLPGVMGNLFRKAAQAAQQAGQANLQSGAQHATNANTPTQLGSFGDLKSIMQALGVGGYSLSRDYAGHTGKDIRTPEGVKLYAPTDVKVKVDFQKGGYGQYLTLTDDDGYKMILAHLKSVDANLLNEIRKTGYATVAAGTYLGQTGGKKGAEYSQNSSGPHLHLEVRDPQNVVQNLERFRIGQGVRVPVETGTPTAPTGGKLSNSVPKPVPVTVPLKPVLEPKELKAEIDAKVKDVQARLQLKMIGKDEAIRELKVIEDSAISLGRKGGPNLQAYADGAKAARSAIDDLKKGQKESVDVLASLERQYEYAGKTGLPAYVSGLKAFIAQQEKVATSAREGSKAQTDAMDNVIAARQKLATVQKAADLGISQSDINTYRARAQEVINLEKGMATSTDLDWKRRAQNRIDSYNALPPAAQKVLELLKGQDSQEVASAKARQTALESVSRAVREGRVSDARYTLEQVKARQADELAAVGLTADQKVRIHEASSGKILSAAYALHAKEKAQADAAVDAWAKTEEAKALTSQERDAEIARRKSENRETERRANIAAQQEQARLLRAATDLQISEGERAADALRKQAQTVADLRYKLSADLIRYSYGQGDAGLVSALASITGYSVEQVKADVDKALAEAKRLNSGMAQAIENAYAPELKVRQDALEYGKTLESELDAALGNATVIVEKNMADQRKSIAELDAAILQLQQDARDAGVVLGQVDVKFLPEDVAPVTQAGMVAGDVQAVDPLALLFGMSAEDILAMGRELGSDFADSIFGGLTEADFSLLGVDVLSKLAVALDGKPEWEKVRASILKGLDLAQAVDATVTDAALNPETYSDGGKNIKAKNAPVNRFAELRDSIFGSAEQLRTDNAFGDWLAAELDKARQASQLTDNELQTLKATLNEIRSGGPALPPDLGAEQLASWDTKLDSLVRGFESGEMAGKDFAAQVYGTLPVLARMAKAADEAGDPKLAEEYRQRAKALEGMVTPGDRAAYSQNMLADAQKQLQAAMGGVQRPYADVIAKLTKMREEAGADKVEIDRLIAGFVRLQQEAAKQEGMKKATDALNTWGNYAKQMAGPVTQMFAMMAGASGETADQWAQDMGSMVNDLVSLGTAIAKGDWAAAAVQVLTTIANWFVRNKKAAEDAAKAVNDYNNQFKFTVDGYNTMTTTKTTTGFLFWQTDHYKHTVDEAGKTLALGLENGFVTGIKNGFAAALQANDFGLFGKTLTTSVGQAVLDGLVEAFVNEAIFKEIIGPKIQTVIAARKTAGKEDDLAAIAELKKAIREGEAEAKSFYDEIYKPIADEFGLGPQQAPAGSIAALQEEISKLQSALNIATNQQERDRLKAEIEQKQRQLDAMEGKSGAVPGTNLQPISSNVTTAQVTPQPITAGATITQSIDLTALTRLDVTLTSVIPQLVEAGRDIREGAREFRDAIRGTNWAALNRQ